MSGTVLILGAASDMGIALAEAYAAKGFGLQLAARSSDRLAPLAADLKIRFGTTVALVELDIADFSKHEAVWKSLSVCPDITISVVGYMKDNEEALTDATIALNTVNSNYTGPMVFLDLVAQTYAKQKKGTIVGISSVAGLRGRQSNFIYGSAKAGFIAYLSGLRNYLFHHQVHVMTVLPGFVYTKMTAHLTLPPLLTATPQEVAKAIVKGVEKKKNTIYVKWFWRYIMMIIRFLPEFQFKKMKL